MYKDSMPNIIISDHLKWFAQSLEPSIEKLDQALKQKEPVFSEEGDLISAAISFEQVGRLVEQLVKHINTMMEQVIADPAVEKTTVYRYSGQFENIIDSMVRLYQEIVEQTDYQFTENFDLLKDGFEKILQQILEWMEAIHNTVERPDIYYHPRPQDIRNGQAEITFTLELDMPYEFEFFADEFVGSARSNKQSPGVFGTIASVVLGIAAYNWLFGDDDD